MPPTEPRVALQALLHAYDNAVRTLGRQLGLGLNDLACLRRLMDGPDVGPAELADFLGITPASATVMVDRLEQRRLVQRLPHPTDRRRRVVRLADEATALVRESMTPLFEAEAAIDAGYSSTERVLITRYLADVEALYEGFGNL